MSEETAGRWVSALRARFQSGAPSSRRVAGVRTVALAASFVASGCFSVGPDYKAPQLEQPAAWSGASPAGLEERPPDLASWWKVLDDPVLDELVDRALAGNTDLRSATARVREARAQRMGAIAAFFPFVDARAAYTKQRTSQSIGGGDDGDEDPGNDGERPGFPAERDLWSTGFDATWEIDVFGGRRRALEQARAQVAGAQASLGDVQVSMLAELATSYVEMRALARRIAIARANAEVQAETRSLADARHRAGLTGELELQQATYNLADTLARVPQLEYDLAAARNRIAVLTGSPPGSLDALLAGERDVPVAPAALAVGIPADLLRRRPDVAAAEQNLVAATAAIGIAKAEMFPRLSISGSFGVAASETGNLFTGDARTFNIGPALRWRILDFGSLLAAVRARSAAADAALADYETTVLRAWEEAGNAIVAWQQEQVRRDRLAEGAEAARIAEELAMTQYEAGLADFQQVLDAQRALRGFEDSLATSSAAVTTRLITAYKALGGGWGTAGDEPAAK